MEEGPAKLTRVEMRNSRTIRSCPLCKSTSHHILASIRADQFCSTNCTYRTNYASILGITFDTRYPLIQCASCSFVYAGYLPSDEFLMLVYDEVIDPSEGYVQTLRPGRIVHHLRIAQYILREFSERNLESPVRLLDYGCGYGLTLSLLRDQSLLECVGFETSQRRIDDMRDRGLVPLTSLDQVREASPYDAIILADVLEHVAEPRELVQSCVDLMSAPGILLVNVPRFAKRDLKDQLRRLSTGQQITQAINLWEHLSYFSPESLRRLLEEEGLVVIEPDTPVDVGLRPRLTGIRRIGNGLKSAIRLAMYMCGHPTATTFVLARKTVK